MYTLIANSTSVLGPQGETIPADPLNSDYAKYLAWVAAGNVATAVPGEILTDITQRLVNDVDALVAGIYSNWTRFEREYELREDAARTFKAAGYVGDPGEWVSAFATSAGMPNQQATDLIIAQADQLHAALVTLGAMRMRKYEILRATDTVSAQDTYDSIVADIKATAATIE